MEKRFFSFVFLHVVSHFKELDSEGAVIEGTTKTANSPILVEDIKPLSNSTKPSSRTRREAESQRRELGDVIVMVSSL